MWDSYWINGISAGGNYSRPKTHSSRLVSSGGLLKGIQTPLRKVSCFMQFTWSVRLNSLLRTAGRPSPSSNNPPQQATHVEKTPSSTQGPFLSNNPSTRPAWIRVLARNGVSDPTPQDTRVITSFQLSHREIVKLSQAQEKHYCIRNTDSHFHIALLMLTLIQRRAKVIRANILKRKSPWNHCNIWCLLTHTSLRPAEHSGSLGHSCSRGGSGVGWRDSWVGWRRKPVIQEKGGTGPQEALRIHSGTTATPPTASLSRRCRRQTRGNRQENKNEENRMSSPWTVWQMQRLLAPK